MRKRIVTGILVLSMAIGVLSGCGIVKSGTETNEHTATDLNEEIRYAVILKTQASDFWVKMRNAIEAKAETLDLQVDIYAVQSEEDFEGQLDILESCIDKGYDGIAVAPLSSTNLIPGIVRANEQGIQIVNIDEKVDEAELTEQGGFITELVITDNVEIGRKAAAFIAERVEPGYSVAIIEGMEGNQSGMDRTLGASEVFNEAGLKICASAPADWNREKALETAASIIEQNEELKAIYCCNDTMALGVLQAVINADKFGEIIVVGTDGDAEAVDSVEAGRLNATVVQDPEGIGIKGLECLVQAVKNGKTGTVGVFPKATIVDAALIFAK